MRASSQRQVGARRRRSKQPLVDQLIEQQRVRGDLRGEEVAVTAQLDEPRARRRVLVQQREVGRARADRLDDPRARVAARGSSGACSLPTSASSAGSSACRRSRARLIELAHQRRARAASSSSCAASPAVAEARARRARASSAARLAPRVSQKRPRSMRTAAAIGAQRRRSCTRREMATDRWRAAPPAAASSAAQLGAAHRARQALAHRRIGGQLVRLLVAEHLQAVLQARAGHGRRRQLRGRRRRQQPRRRRGAAAPAAARSAGAGRGRRGSAGATAR